MSNDTLYTVQIIFHSAANLPVADINTLSCDPFIHASIDVPSRPRPRDERLLRWRTPTIRRNRDPVWNSQWIVSGIPSSGFELVMRLKDEDPGDRDDRMGQAVAQFFDGAIKEGFEEVKKEYKIYKRKGSFRPWIQTYITALIPGQKLRKHNRVTISVKVLGRALDQTDQRVYTVGPNAYSQHFSPVIGSVVNRGASKSEKARGKQETRQIRASTFIANKLQLTGPVPHELRLHFVGYRPIIDTIFNSSGILGHILNHGLRKQYRVLYSHDKATIYGVIDAAEYGDSPQPMQQMDVGNANRNDNPHVDAQVEHEYALPPSQPHRANPHAAAGPSTQPQAYTAKTTLARQFLKMTQWGKGSTLFTFVITLDGEWRFAETGDEFAIDFLSKHVMHANAAKYIAFSGEFFVRRIDDGHEGHDGGNVQNEGEDSEKDPQAYELIIDNNSGTYRPRKELLPIFQSWLSDPRRLGGLGRVTAMDAFDDKLKSMKEERKEEKKRLAGGKCPVKKAVAVRSGSSVSSISAERLGMESGQRSKLSSGEIEQALESVQTENAREVKDDGLKHEAASKQEKQNDEEQNKDKSEGRSYSRDSGVHV